MKRIKFLIVSAIALVLLLSCEAPLEQPADYKAAELKSGGPEISVYLGADEVASKSGVVHFGLLKSGRFKELTLTIKNSGNEELVIDPAQIKIVPAEAFTLPNLPAELKAAPGSSVDLTVRFDYQKWKNSEAYLYLFSNDSDESIYWFTLKGQSDSGVSGEPEEQISLFNNGRQILFGNTFISTWVKLGEKGQSTFTITNTAKVDVNLKDLPIELYSQSLSNFTVLQPISRVLKPGESTDFTVHFEPDSEGVREALLVIKGSTTLFSFIYRAEGWAPRVSLLRLGQDAGGSFTFPSSRPGTLNQGMKFIVQQSGNGEINFTSPPYIKPLIGDESAFSIAGTPVFSGSDSSRSAEIFIKFAPISFFESEAELVIPNNSSNNSEIRITLKGKGIWGRFLDGGYYYRKVPGILGESSQGEIVIAADTDSVEYQLTVINDSGNLTNHKLVDYYSYSSIRDMVITKEDYLYVGGMDYDYNSGYDWWIKKFSLDGKEVFTGWNKKFSSTDIYSKDTDSINALTLDSSGNLFIGGHGWNLISSSSRTDWWLKKISSSGVEDSISWNKMYSGNDRDSLYNKGDAITVLEVDDFGNLYAGGYGSNLVGVKTGYDWWIKKFSADGKEDVNNWNKKLSYLNEVYDSNIEGITALKTAHDGSLFIAGGRLSPHYVDCFSYLKKYNADGVEDVINWNKKLNILINQIIIDKEENVFVVGGQYEKVDNKMISSWVIKKFSREGVEDTVNWDKKISYTSEGNSIHSAMIDKDGNLVVLGDAPFMGVYNSSYNNWLQLKKFSSDGVEF